MQIYGGEVKLALTHFLCRRDVIKGQHGKKNISAFSAIVLCNRYKSLSRHFLRIYAALKLNIRSNLNGC